MTRTAMIRRAVVLAALWPAAASAAPPDALPPGAVRRLGPLRQFASPRLGVAAFSADGKRLVAAAGEWTLHVWDQPDRLLYTLPHHPDHTPCCAALSPDGRTLAVGDSDGSVRLRAAGAAGNLLHKVMAHDNAVQAVAFAADGKRWASVGDAGLRVPLWDGGTKVGQIETESAEVNCLAFAGNHLLLGCADTGVEVWDGATARRVRTVKTGHSVRSLAVTADGATAFAQGEGHALLAIEVATGRTLRTIDGHSGAVLTLSCSADGTILASTGVDGGTRVWDTASGEELQRLYPAGEGGSALALSPDGRTLVVANVDHTLDRWDLERGTGGPQLVGHADEVEAVAFLADGKEVQSWSLSGARRWQAATGKPLPAAGGDRPVREKLLTSPGGKYRVTVDPESSVFAMLVSVETGREIPLEGTLRSLRAAAFSRDDKLLAGAGSDGNVTLWESETGQVLAEFRAHEERVNCIAFAPDGRTFATGGGDGSVLLWSPARCGSDLPERWRDPLADDLESMWKAMTAENGADAFSAMRALVASPRKAVPFVRDKLPPPLDVRRIKQLITQLDDDEFEKREKASQELERLGRDAEQPLRDALAGKVSVEVRRRVEELLENLKGDDSPRVRCWSRAVFVLENIDTPEALAVLKLLAEGDRVARAAEDARAALKRKGG